MFYDAGNSHSLGILIEWKRNIVFQLNFPSANDSHSLGILIEWKPWVSKAAQSGSSSFPLAGDIN